MSCLYEPCNSPIHKDSLCHKHYLIEKFRNNPNIDDLGIAKFAFYLFPEIFQIKYGMAQMHKEILWTILFDKEVWTKEDRNTVIATFRGAAKTSWCSFIFPVYIAAMRPYGIKVAGYTLPDIDYLVMKSKTGKSSGKSLYNIHQAFGHSRFQALFGDLRPTVKEVRDKQGKNASNILILNNSRYLNEDNSAFILESLGINQQIRGTNFFGKRPKRVLYDDPETIDNTKTIERRANNKLDLLDETFGAVDDFKGGMIYIGNMVHSDCLLNHLLHTPGWKKLFYQITYKDKNDLDELGNPKEKSTWEQRYSMELIAKKKKYYLQHRELGELAWYKNYYNIIKTTSNPLVRNAKITYFQRDGVNFIRVEEVDKTPRVVNVYITVGLDKAQTSREDGSSSAIVVLGQDVNRIKYVIDNITGRFDQRDRYTAEEHRPKSGGMWVKEEDVKFHVQRRGCAEESVRTILKYSADGFGMGIESQQEGTYNDVLDLIRQTGYNRPFASYGYRSAIDK